MGTNRLNSEILRTDRPRTNVTGDGSSRRRIVLGTDRPYTIIPLPLVPHIFIDSPLSAHFNGWRSSYSQATNKEFLPREIFRIISVRPTKETILINRRMADYRSSDRQGDYRSRRHNVHSSSDDDSDEGEEDTPLWRQKKEKYFRKHRDGLNASPMQSQTFMQQSKKVNNVWGSVLTEQDLTQTLVSGASVDKPNDVSLNERNVESYDFTKKYTDDRPPGDEVPKKNSIWSFGDSDIQSSIGCSSRGRSIIGYEDTLSRPRDNNDLRSVLTKKSRKRRADFSGDRKHSEVHRRLGDKKVKTFHVGEADVNIDMEESVFNKKIADFLNEPKVDLIERITQHLGKDVALRVFNATRDVEDAGGIYTMDGSRRRTPGGVYFTLLKQQPEFNTKARAFIFSDDVEQHKKWKKESRKRTKKQKRQRAKKESGKNNSVRSRSPDKVENKAEELMEDGEIRDESEERTENMDNDNNEHSDSDSGSSSDASSSQNRKCSNLSFEEELAAAKKVILERSKSKENTEDKPEVEMTDLEVAEAHVIDIEIDG
ncbi:hypothetical protein ACF0H5_013300 [Mactra antiquata]